MLRTDTEHVSVSQAARRLGVSHLRVRQLIAEGKLPATRTVLGHLIPAEAVEALAEEREKRQRERRANGEKA